MDVAKFNERVMGPAHVENVVDVACRSALSYRGVAHITFPVDLQSAQAERKGSKHNVPLHSWEGSAQSARLPAARDLEKAADILNAGKKVAILAGRGALHATGELLQVAEAIAAPVATALLGKGAIPDDSPYAVGTVGLLGTAPSQEALEQCDTLLIVGSTFPYVEYYPKPGAARAVQIELDPVRLGLRYPIEVGLVGDSRVALEQLLPLLRRKPDRSFLENSQDGMKKCRALLHDRATRQDKPMKPQVVAWQLGKRLPDDAIVTSDSGTVASWFAQYVPARRGQMFSLRHARVDGERVALRRRRRVFHADGRVRHLREIPPAGEGRGDQEQFARHDQMGADGVPRSPGVRLRAAADRFCCVFARACGASGITIDDPAQCGDALEQALAMDGPVLVEAVVDPHEPPLPPRISLEQAKHFAQALARGTPNREKIALTVLSDKVRELL
jgi:pyruvate dehydrogenase (quinone)